MKKKIAIILLTIAACFLFACGGETPETVKPDLTINKTSAQMIYGDTLELIANHNVIEGETLSWSSEDDKVAVVEGGTVTAVGVGSTRIKVSYGDESKFCNVLVTYGDIQPVLNLKSLDNGISLYKGDRYEIEGEVSFNAKSYPCDIFAKISDENVLEFDGETNELIAKSKGSSNVTFYTEWNGFSGALLSVETEVDVYAPLYADTTVVYSDGTSELTDEIELWTNDSWYGENYDKSVTLLIEAFNGNDKLDASTITCVPASSSLISYDAATGEVKVNSEGRTGETTLNITVSNGGESMTTQVAVSVKCPIADYSEVIEYNASVGLVGTSWEDLFGENYEITDAYQGETVVSFQKNGDNGILKGLKVNGTDTEAFSVYSAKGALRFTNVDAYTLVLTESNIVNVLAPANVPKGYYVLKGDVTADFTGRRNGNSADCFLGTFDGRGYTLNATVAGYGVFGSLGNGAVIKNTRFNFTFGGTAATLSQWGISIPEAYCGIAANNDNHLEGYATVKGEYHVYFDNLYITTTNYKKNSFAIMGVKPFFLHMNEVLVNLAGLTEDYEYTDATTDYSALFGADRAGCMTGYADSALGSIKNGKLIKNVYVITKKFMPVSAFESVTVTDQGTTRRTFVWYAGNDVKKLGKTGELSTLRLTSLNGSDTTYDKLFGSVFGERSLTTYNPFVLRYDTVDELKATGISRVGGWTLD